MDKIEQKNMDFFESDENIECVHDQIGMSKKNFKNTYLHNKSGKDKQAMIVALSLGSICLKHYISKDDLMDGIAFVITKRKLSGISKG